MHVDKTAGLFSAMRGLRKGASLAGAAGIALFLAGGAQAQQAASQPHVPLQKAIGVPYADRPVPSLAVLNAASAKLDGGKLVLSGIAPNAIVFADRPVRAAGHEMISQFLMQWDEGKNSFAVDPPNATVSVLGANPGEVSDAVMVLKSPKLEGSTLTFDVSVLEGTLAAGGPVAVFIDAWAVRGPYGGGVAHFGGYGGAYYHGGAYWHAPVYHGAWYAHPYYPAAGAAAVGLAAGAAIGAAAASRPLCGYYPYPPCY
ncbi:hypothetical protein GGR25_004801 [Kaistia hirudinis]|uniref:Uncharacterized protein n=2 Tax=Kaistia hirudinis TaxID=1293440 RepID=A0A840AWZ8_9HYPH|nr:hypothetical protein [Kaistia hirudinis]MBB3933723.1 hypothetical protein [Kaistia hirudinis]